MEAERFAAAGGTLFKGPNDMDGHEKGEGNKWRDGRTPWGSIVELVSTLGAQEYERHTPLRRWKPSA